MKRILQKSQCVLQWKKNKKEIINIDIEKDNQWKNLRKLDPKNLKNLKKRWIEN
jgi:hypothetical protein